jgi:hypothetical protein
VSTSALVANLRDLEDRERDGVEEKDAEDAERQGASMASKLRRVGEHRRRPGQEEEGGYARTRVGDGHEELARRRLPPEGIAEREGEDERGGPLQAQLARAPGESCQAGAEERACEHEPAPGPKLGSGGDRQGERERPEERGEVALGAKDRQGEARVDERQAQERRSLGGESLPLAVGEGDDRGRPQAGAREDRRPGGQEALAQGGQAPVLEADEEGAERDGQERRCPNGWGKLEGVEDERLHNCARQKREAREGDVGSIPPHGPLDQSHRRERPEAGERDVPVVEGRHRHEELEHGQ